MVKSRGKGVWLIQIYLGRGEGGKKKYYHETAYFPTKSLAQARESELKKKFHKQKYGPNCEVQTVGDLLDKWHATITEQKYAREKTLKVYMWHIERLKPVVGSLNLYDLTAWDIQQALKGQFLDVSDRTRRNFYATLKNALRRGFAWGLIPIDVTAGILTPKAEQKEKPTLELKDLELLLEVAKGYKHHLIIRLLTVTGARLGEILGLRWCDIDFNTGKIRYVKSVDSHERVIKDCLKTKSSKRATILDKDTLEYLKEKQKNDKVVAINKNERLIFLADDGGPMRHKAVQTTLRRILKKTKLEKDGMSIHCLRHSVITNLYDQGVPLADIMALSGHANIQSMENYIHSQKVGLNLLDSTSQVANRMANN